MCCKFLHFSFFCGPNIVVSRLRTLRPGGHVHKCDKAGFCHKFPACPPLTAPVIAVVEEEVVLLCQFSPLRDAGNMEVSWYRAHPPRSGASLPEPPSPVELQRLEYGARAEVLLENATRRLSDIQKRKFPCAFYLCVSSQ